VKNTSSGDCWRKVTTMAELLVENTNKGPPAVVVYYYLYAAHLNRKND